MSYEMRWSNKHPQLSVIVEDFMTFPEEIQALVATTFLKILERMEHTTVFADSKLSVGVEKLKHVYKSKQRKRSYDSIPEVHRMMNFLALLDEQYYNEIIAELEPLVTIAKTCNEYGNGTQEKSFVERAFKKYFETNLDAALKLIASQKSPSRSVRVDSSATKLVCETVRQTD